MHGLAPVGAALVSYAALASYAPTAPARLPATLADGRDGLPRRYDQEHQGVEWRHAQSVGSGCHRTYPWRAASLSGSLSARSSGL